MRILYLSYQYPPDHWGGIGAYTKIMARAMASRGHEVHVLSCDDNRQRQDSVEDGVFVHRRPLWPRRREPAWLHPTRWRLRLAGTCYRESRRLGVDFDLVEAPDHMAEGVGLALLGGAPVVVCLHDGARMFRRRRPGDFLEYLFLRRAAMVRSPSKMLLRHGIGRGWFAARRARLLRPPIDLDAWDPGPTFDTGPVVLVVGLLHAVKAPEVAIQAIAQLRGRVPGVELVILGRSMGGTEGLPYDRWLQKQAEDLGVALRLIDEVPRPDLQGWYRRARVVAIPSHRDNFPMVGLEAMACGRPLVCTDATGTAEVIVGTGAGQVVPAADPVAMAAALEVYLLDTAAAVRAGRLGRELVESRHSPATVAESVEAAYSDFLFSAPAERGVT